MYTCIYVVTGSYPDCKVQCKGNGWTVVGSSDFGTKSYKAMCITFVPECIFTFYMCK